MAKTKYVDKKFQKKTMDFIDLINRILADEGDSMTVRQLHYALVSAGHIENTRNEYSRVCNTVNDARMAGLIDWEAIEDRTRWVRCNAHWENPKEAVLDTARQYMTDWRATQPIYVECWIEKDALIGVLEPLRAEYDVPVFSCRGYPSSTALRDAAFRLRGQTHRENRVILYGGDFDPSGLDITRSIQDTLRTFGAYADVRRVGLTWEQIQQYNPPPCFAKDSDKRSAKYKTLFGDKSWELDALGTRVLREIYRDHIIALTDFELIRAAQEHDREGVYQLSAIHNSWDRLFQS